MDILSEISKHQEAESPLNCDGSGFKAFHPVSTKASRFGGIHTHPGYTLEIQLQTSKTWQNTYLYFMSSSIIV